MSKLPFTVLLVEDEPKVATFIKRGLEENDFEVEIAFDGLMGKSKFKKTSLTL